MNTWEEVEQQPEFGVLTPEDKAAVHTDWHQKVLNDLADEDPEKIDPEGVNRFIATEKARNESFKTGRPFDAQDAVDMEPVRSKARVDAQAKMLSDYDALERERFALKDAEKVRNTALAFGGERAGLDEGPDPEVEKRKQAVTMAEGNFTPELLQQAKEAREALKGERPTAVLGSDLYTDPLLVLNKDKYRAAIAASNASPEAKARAMADFTAKRQQVAAEALKTFRVAGESPIPGAQDFPTWEAEQSEEVRKMPPEEKALRYMKSMEGRGDMRKLSSAIGTGLLQGGTDIASQGLGVAAMVSNSGKLAEHAAEVSKGAEALEEVAKLEGEKQAPGTTTVGGAARLLPPMAAAIAPAALTGGGSMAVASGIAGLQTAGAQFPTTYTELRKQGATEEEALRASRNAAITSGLITTALTAAFGKTGAEAALITGQGGKELVKNRLVAALKGAAKGAVAEIPEELLDEAASQVIEQRTIDPTKPVSQIVDEFSKTAPDLAMQIALLGGAGGAIGGYRGSTTAPAGAVPVPAAPTDGTPAPVNIQTPVVSNGQTIAYIPQGSDLTPDDVAEFADDPETLKTMARAGKITLPEIVTPVPGVNPAITQEMNANVAAGAALAPGTVEALQASQAATAEVSGEPGEFVPTPVKAPGETDNSISEPKGQQVSPVTTATETPSNAANVAGGSQSVQTEPAEGSIPAVTAPIVPAQGETSTAEIQPTQNHAPRTETLENGVREEPAPGDQSREVQSPESGDSVQRAEESGREEIAPANVNVVWAPQINEPAAATVNGHPVVGTVGAPLPGGKTNFHYNWNGKPQTAVVSFNQLTRPVTALSEAPRYIYTQEQNSRKAGKHIPVTPGVHADFDFRKAFASMAEDKSLSRIYQEIARILSKMPQFTNMDLHIVADGRRPYAGEYSHSNGRSAIAVNLRQVARGKVDALGTLLHEALHHVTLAKVRDPQGDVELEAAHALNSIRLKLSKLPGAERFGYELGTNEEFITGVFTHPGFQDFLASLPADFSPVMHAGKFRSLLSEIFRLITQLVTGKPVARGSTLDQSMASILALFETPHRNLDVGPLQKLSAESKPEGYRSPADLLAETAAKMRGEKSENPAGLHSMFNPQAKRPTTGERTLFETPKTKPVNLTTAYQKAQTGRSTAWVPIKDVYEQAKASDPSLTPEAFMAHINEQNDTGGIMVSPVENVATVEAAKPFVVGGAGVEMLVPETAGSMAEEEESPEFRPPPGFAFTRARFAPTKPELQTIKIEGDEGATKKAYDWINVVGPLQAANLILTNRTPGWMTGNEQTIAVSGLIAGLANVSADSASTEDEKTVARATAQRLGVKWKDLGAAAAREMRQRGVQGGETLQPIAQVLAAEEILADRGKKVLEKQFEGGEEGATAATAGAAEKATADADERLENIISRLMGSLNPKQTAMGALAKMFRGKGQRDQIVDEVAKALMLKTRGNVVTPERKTALANLASSLKSTLAASVKGEKKPAPERTMQDLLTSAFVNQVSEGPTFEAAWKEGRQKVLDMLIDIELDKQYHPAEARLKDLRAKLAHLEAGNVDQQKASAAERAQLATQIANTKAEMEAARDAVIAMTPQFEAQRDKLMPAAPTVAFDPVASREAISRAFEKAGYTAELATGLDKSGKRALSIKDALLNRKRATDAVMKQFDEAMAAKDATTQHDWPQARALAERAVKETLDSWQKQIDEDKATKLQATKDNLLSEDSKALEKLVNSVRDKIAPGEDWSDILHDLPRTQDERLAAIKERVAKHEALKDLTPDEAANLAENIDKLWQRERLKAFQDELLKAGVLKARSTKAAANVVSAAPELLRLMNLGVFNSSTFREAVSKRFGIKMMSNTQAQALRKLASEAWEQPQGVLRNRKLKQLLEGIQHVTGSSWSEVVSSYWIASVLSGLNTQFNTWGAVLNGAATNLIQAGAQLVRGNGAAAVGAQLQWWKALNDGMKEALHILWTGDTSFTKRFEQDIHNALDGEKGAHPIAIGERMWKEGTVIQKIPGALMMLVGRSMVAADHVNNIATTQGAMAVARAMNPELYEGRSSFTQKEINDARAQALNETTGGADPANGEERRIVGVRTREILNSGLSQEHREQASLVGDQAAFQNDPTGLFGSIYRAVKTGLSSKVRHLDEVAQDEEVNKIARALAAVGAGSVYAATGTRFMRYGFNLGNEFIRYMPGSWVLNKVAPILGRNLSPMQQDLLIGKNLVGAMALAALYAMFGGDDEDKDGEWHLEGPWDALSPDEKNERRTAGKAPNTMWKIENGEIKRIGYGQWALAGLIGATGSMLDEKRYEPEKWKERGVAGHMLRGAVTGLYQLQNVAALENLAKMLGQSPSNSSDKIQGPADRLAEMGTAYAGGFAPTFLKDLDKWDDPRNFKAEGAWEKLVREMPVARRYVNDGRPQFNRIGQDVRVHREPYSRLFTSDEVDKATATYGHLLSRGLDFPSPSTNRKIIKDGRKVPMETLGKGVTYDFEKAVAAQYGKFLAEHGEELLKMPTKVADKAINARAQRIIDLEVRKVQAKVNTP